MTKGTAFHCADAWYAVLAQTYDFTTLKQVKLLVIDLLGPPTALSKTHIMFIVLLGKA